MLVKAGMEDGGPSWVPAGLRGSVRQGRGEVELDDHGHKRPLRGALVGGRVQHSLTLVVLGHVHPVEVVQGGK